MQRGNDVAQRFLVLTGVQRFFEFVALGVLDGDVADAADTEAFSEAFQRLVAVLRVDDGKFQAGRAAVQDKNVVGHDDFL